MRITRIDFEGQQKSHFATASRKRTADHIDVTVLTPGNPDGRGHYVQADCKDDIFAMAECLQVTLDGYEGSGSEIQEYYRELLRLSDI